MSYHGAPHMYATFILDLLRSRIGAVNAAWWSRLQDRVVIHRRLGTSPDVVADMFADEWRMIQNDGGWRGESAVVDGSESMTTALYYAAVAKRHGFA